MTPVIHTEDLAKRFRGGVDALNGLSLQVPEGSVFGLIGPNGAGKTTTIKILMNIFRSSSGVAEVLGVDSRELSPEDYLKPFYPTWDDQRANELTEQFSLPLGRKLRHLSRGMRMKVALVASLAYRPRLLLLDEPFSGLDPMVRDDLGEGLVDSADETTILVSSHDLADIESFASHIGYLETGRLQFSEAMTSPDRTVPGGRGNRRLGGHDTCRSRVAGELAAPRNDRGSDPLRRNAIRSGEDPAGSPPSPGRRSEHLLQPDAFARNLRHAGPQQGAGGIANRRGNVRQTMHILKKDIRYLRVEIGLVLAMALCFGWMQNRTFYPWWTLLGAAGIYLIARVIQAEPIPGSEQFWITRPYRWTSLLAAKTAFIVLFVNLPVFLAQLVVFVRDGFPLVPNLSGLLWGFLLMIFGVAFPVAALAALTPGLMQFILVGILAFGLGTLPIGFISDVRWPIQIGWIRDSIKAASLILVSAGTLYAQYRTRRTSWSRWVAVAVLTWAF